MSNEPGPARCAAGFSRCAPARRLVAAGHIAYRLRPALPALTERRRPTFPTA
jgi:hypothetical protein